MKGLVKFILAPGNFLDNEFKKEIKKEISKYKKDNEWLTSDDFK